MAYITSILLVIMVFVALNEDRKRRKAESEVKHLWSMIMSVQQKYGIMVDQSGNANHLSDGKLLTPKE